jgi:hypothetical protein
MNEAGLTEAHLCPASRERHNQKEDRVRLARLRHGACRLQFRYATVPNHASAGSLLGVTIYLLRYPRQQTQHADPRGQQLYYRSKADDT